MQNFDEQEWKWEDVIIDQNFDKVYNIIDCDEYPEFPGGLEEYRNYIRRHYT